MGPTPSSLCISYFQEVCGVLVWVSELTNWNSSDLHSVPGYAGLCPFGLGCLLPELNHIESHHLRNIYAQIGKSKTRHLKVP